MLDILFLRLVPIVSLYPLFRLVKIGKKPVGQDKWIMQILQGMICHTPQDLTESASKNADEIDESKAKTDTL